MKKMNKLIAILSMFSIMATSIVAAEAAKESELVNIAPQSSIYSSMYGTGSYNGDLSRAVGAAIDGDMETSYISCATTTVSDVLTIDLQKLCTVKDVVLYTYGNDDLSDAFSMGNSTFSVVAKTSRASAGVALSQVKNNESNYFPAVGGGYYSTFTNNDDETKFRFIVITYTKGETATHDLFMPEIEIHTTKKDAEDNLAVVSQGILPTMGQAATWGEAANVTDGNFDTTYFVYGTSDGVATATFDLGGRYAMEKVQFYMATGTISDVLVANCSDFSDAEYLVYDNGDWVLDDGAATNKFRFVKAIPNVGTAGEAVFSEDATPSVVYREIYIYSRQSSVDEVSSLVNISTGAETFLDGCGTPVAGAQAVINDGDSSVKYFAYGVSEEPSILMKFSHAQTISDVLFINNEGWWGGGTGFVKQVLASNDPNFNDYVELIRVARNPSGNGYNDYSSEWTLVDDTQRYRFVKALFTPGPAHWSNWADSGDTTASFTLMEFQVLSTAESANLANVALNRPVTLQSGYSWYAGLDNPANITNETGQLTAANSGLAVIELEYPMTITQVELQLPYDVGRAMGYDVYLSDTPSVTADSTQILSSSVIQPAYVSVTTLIPVSTEKKYKYVLIGNPSNFWIISGVRVLANDVPVGIEAEATFADGALEAGGTETLQLKFRSATDVDKKVKFIVSRFDDGLLTDVSFSDAITLTGKHDSVEFNYDISEYDAINEDTQLKGFVWETDVSGNITYVPFAGIANKNAN